MLKKDSEKIFVISAPSGTGKTTIATILKEKIPELRIIITATTRRARPEEKNGINYSFLSEKKFKDMIFKEEFIEWAKVYKNYYGTPKKKLFEHLRKGDKILLTIDTQGGMSIKKIFPAAILIGILPPSLKEQERRIRERRSGLSEEEIKERLKAARNERRILMTEYNFRLVNSNLEKTIERIIKIINQSC